MAHRRVGITGGTGFLGRHLSQRLLRRGDEVVVFTRSPERAAGRVPSGVQLAAWDPVHAPLPPAQLDVLDAVVNLVGESIGGFLTPARQHRARVSRIASTRHLAEAWSRAAHPPRVLVSSSAVGIYGDGGERELDESSPPGRGFLADLCRDWEAAAAPVAGLGTRLVILRTGLPLSPDGGLLRVLLPLFRWGLGPTFGSGRQWMSWIHLEDWLELVCTALEQESLARPVNATAPEPVRNRELSLALGAAVHRPAWIRVPGWVLRATLPRADDLLLSGQRALPRAALASGFRFRFPRLEDALHDLLG